jgi:hypothetical protein
LHTPTSTPGRKQGEKQAAGWNPNISMVSDNYKDINFKDQDRISSRKKVDEQNSMYDTFMDFEKDRTIDNELLRLSNQEEPKKLKGIKGFFKNSLNKLKKKKKNEMTPRKGSFDSGAPRTPNLES